MPIDPILPTKESSQTEFMERLDEVRAVREICAFLNAGGGALYVGVGDRGEPVGLRDPEGDADRLRSALGEQLVPSYPAAVRVEQGGNRSYVVVEVPPGPEPPYTAGGKFFVRKEAHTGVGSDADLSNLLASRRERARRWERQPALGITIRDMDEEEVRRTASEAGRRRLSGLADLTETEAILDGLQLLDGGQLTNAAAVLFARNPARHYPQTRVRAARFEDDDATEFVDNRVFEGHAFHLAEAVQAFLRQHLPVSSRLERGAFQRTDAPAYPPFALREGLMNALVHRDYSAFSGGLSVSIYPNRLEIWNSGRLPEGLTTKDLKTARVSRPHNPDIAHVFFLRGLVERWGIGTRRIVEECRAEGLPDPRWEEVGGGIRLTLYLRHAESAVLEEINDRMGAFLRESRPGDTLTSTDYTERYAREVTARSARTDLARLVEMGFLEREGQGKAMRYRRTDAELPDATG